MVTKWFLCAIFLLASLIRSSAGASTLADSISSDDEVNKTTYEIVKLRGFTAINHYLTTTDGYILNLVQCKNPLINNGTRGVVLFIHGTATNANFYIVNSVGAHPIDHSNIDINSKSEEELKELFKNDPNRNSFPFLLLTLGYDVILFNRRGTYQSQGHVGANTQPYLNPITNIAETLFGGLPRGRSSPETRFKRQASNSTLDNNNEDTTDATGLLKGFSDILSFGNIINPRYWNYTFDQQIFIDFPQVIDFILDLTQHEKLAVVGHSNGGLITLAALSAIPEINDKISTALLWAPALYPRGLRDRIIFTSAYPILHSYIGPLLPKMTLPAIHDFLAVACQIPLTQDIFCEAFSSIVFGYGGQQQVLTAGTVDSLFDTYSSRQILHYAQSILKGKTHHFDYDSDRQNLIAYNQTKPPIYDVSKITNTRMSFYIGNHDGQVLMEAVQAIIDDLTVKPAEVVYINNPGVYFNHISFALHEDVGNLMYFNCLKAIARP